MVDRQESHCPSELNHQDAHQQGIEIEGAVFVVIQMQSELLALDEIYPDEVVACRISADEYDQYHFPRVDIKDSIDAVDSAGYEKDREHYYRLVQIEPGINQSDFFRILFFFPWNEKSVKSDQGYHEKERREEYEIFLYGALSHREEKHHTADGKQGTRDDR